ncbi:MAG: tannase/feruloyl esterase family alpha/beta hydrolase, partial [Thermoanaerobaculia bacterium]|nr:tannase/feruloyl esterase family alpha/beta hydrolase [Thermoanaerobaculia bacterium]
MTPYRPEAYLLAAVLLLPAVAAARQPQTGCADLADLELPLTRITTAAAVEAGSLDPPGRTPRLADMPAICRVAGVIEPAVRFEVWLPLADWNGKLQGVGNGGMAGTISYGPMAAAVGRGYAAASTDTGHEASGNAFDASWAL